MSCSPLQMPLMDRRYLLGSVFATIATSTCPICVGSALARGHAANNIYCAAGSGSTEIKALIARRLSTTGNRDLDELLISEMRDQARHYGYVPVFQLYKGGMKNALAIPKGGDYGKEVFAEYPDVDGLVLYSLDMMNEQLNSGTWGGAVVAGVIAHENGHIYQYNENITQELAGMAETVKFVELHADFMSGFYIGKKYRNDPRMNVRQVASETYDLGDYAYNNRAHHGTPLERTRALQKGFEFYDPSRTVADASAHGIEFLKTDKAFKASRQ